LFIGQFDFGMLCHTFKHTTLEQQNLS